jgi:hypothetical protein
MREAMKLALEEYMSAFGQALEAHGIPLQEQQIKADRQAREALAKQEQGERQSIAAWLEQECDEQYLADRVRAGDFAKEKGHTENYAALGDDCPDHLPPSLVGVGEGNSNSKQEQGEPVAMWDGYYQFEVGNLSAYKLGETKWIPLYTTPQQRTWVGLTDEQIFVIKHNWITTSFTTHLDFARAIEAKLKEKNT